jgi:hypothetical protein
MKVSGFTFVRNGVGHDFPVVEAIRSILPMSTSSSSTPEVRGRHDGADPVDRGPEGPDHRERLGRCEAEGRGDLPGADQPRLDQCGGLAFYLQADEVVHEEELPAYALMEENLNDGRRSWASCSVTSTSTATTAR